MKVLVNAYACSPNQGSEPGMGWNFVRCLSEKNELHIITESKYKKAISEYLEKNPSDRLGGQSGASELKENMFFKGFNWDFLNKRKYVSPIVDIINF